MRKILASIIITVFIAQFMMSGIEYMATEDPSERENIPLQLSETSALLGAAQIPCDSFSSDGIGGPLWEQTSSYSTNDIVEYPVGSGDFYLLNQANVSSSNSTINPTASNAHEMWAGPCSCADIATGGGVGLWDSAVNYLPWQIAEWNNTFWIAQDAGAMAGDEPVVGNDLWVQCAHEDSSPCDELVGMMNVSVWSSTVLVTEGEIYEYPVNSGEFYMVAPFINNQTVGAPGVDLDAWDEDYCDCRDIWNDSGQPVWDSTIEYLQQAVVEWPAGSNNLYISYDHGVGVEPAGADDYLWRSCDGQQPSGNLCEDLNGYGGMPWMNSTLVTTGEVYEFPAGSGVFHAVAPGFSNQTVGAPGSDFQSWSKDSCSCEDIWAAASSPVWDSNTVYTVGALVEYPSGTGDIWMAIVSQTTTGVTPDQPFADGNQWEVCGGEQPAGDPCGAANSMGVWDDLSRVSTGEVYEYPAGSQDYYEVVIQGYLDQDVSSPLIDLDVWAPVDCPCEETWMNNGEPVWAANTSYSGSDVVEWPAGSGHLYVTADPTGISASGGEPGVDTHWILCSESDESANGTPCAGLNIVGVWDSSTNVTSGEIYEYPVNSGTYYQVNAGGPFWSVSAPDIDMDVWSPIDCPCKETWVANGQPAWVANTAYQGNYVVEHPAGSGNLYTPLESGGVSIGGGEPGVDTHWVLCDGKEPSASGNPCAGLNIVGVWNSSTNVTSGEIYEYPVNSGTYYQVNAGGPFWSVSAPDIDMDVWSPIDCPCKETWNANGMPVWNSSNNGYAGNYVVEWPAGTGTLYISEGGGLTAGTAEPGIDGHWILCKDNSVLEEDIVKEDSEEVQPIPAIGVIGTVAALSLGFFISTRRQDHV